MRLVDWNKIKISYDKQISGTITEPIYNIKVEAPTVEAVPIDWLLNQLLEENLLETHHTICCLWERWKEENE